MLQDTDISGKFLNRTPVAQEIMSVLDKWENMKLKTFSAVKEAVN